jgi:hypothetical protein
MDLSRLKNENPNKTDSELLQTLLEQLNLAKIEIKERSRISKQTIKHL